MNINNTTIKNNTIKEILEVIKKSENIVIAGHINPDPDAIGSSIALAMSIKKLNKNVNVLLDNFNEKYNILNFENFIYKGDINNLKIDLFISLDCATKERLGNYLDLFLNCKNNIVIDHHISNNRFGKYNYIDYNISSTSELVYNIVYEIGNIDKNIASCIYMGILTDTGGFRHKNTSAKTISIIANLISLGINFSHIYNKIMKVKSIKEINILKLALDKLKIVEDIPVCYIIIKLEDMDKLNINYRDLDGISEITLNIENIEVGIFIYEKSKNEVKVSLRSLEIDVNNIASYFGGGGHINASGFVSNKSIDETLKDVLNKLRKEF